MDDLIADDGARLHATAGGTGPRNVLFLHCMGGGIESWRPLWERLHTAGARCVA